MFVQFSRLVHAWSTHVLGRRGFEGAMRAVLGMGMGNTTPPHGQCSKVFRGRWDRATGWKSKHNLDPMFQENWDMCS